MNTLSSIITLVKIIVGIAAACLVIFFLPYVLGIAIVLGVLYWLYDSYQYDLEKWVKKNLLIPFKKIKIKNTIYNKKDKKIITNLTNVEVEFLYKKTKDKPTLHTLIQNWENFRIIPNFSYTSDYQKYKSDMEYYPQEVEKYERELNYYPQALKDYDEANAHGNGLYLSSPPSPPKKPIRPEPPKEFFTSEYYQWNYYLDTVNSQNIEDKLKEIRDFKV